MQTSYLEPPTAESTAFEFTPPLLRLQERAPNPLGRAVLWALLALLVVLLFGAVFGRLDIVAVADGKLVPASYVKIEALLALSVPNWMPPNLPTARTSMCASLPR